MKKENGQGVALKDISKKGKDRNWRGRKVVSLKLAEVFDYLGYRDSLISRVRTCGDVLRFIQLPDDSLKLYQAYFCKNKLCPMCNWRRSMKYSAQVGRIIDEAVVREPKGRFLFLTLTLKNVRGVELDKTLKDLSKGFGYLMKYKKVAKNMLGFVRSIEVTYNEKDGTYHPHIHVLLFVKSSYFQGGQYLSQEEWTNLWQKAMKLDYTPIVDIRAVKDTGKGIKGAALEVAKYPMKPMDISLDKADVVEDLYQGTYKKRQIGFGGIFKEIRKQLMLDDLENGDLVQTEQDKVDMTIGQKMVARWSASKADYILKVDNRANE